MPALLVSKTGILRSVRHAPKRLGVEVTKDPLVFATPGTGNETVARFMQGPSGVVSINLADLIKVKVSRC